MKAFPIDFIRQVIEQTLEEQHLQNPNKYFGGKDQVNLFSFYEQLQKEDEVDRYTEIYKDLVNQQNRTGLIMNGTIIAPENPTITNLYDCDIIPMNFTCSFRVKLADRDRAIETINHLISVLKGRKQDICEFDDSGKLFKVGTIGNYYNPNETNTMAQNGDFLGVYDEDFSVNQWMTTEKIPELDALDIDINTSFYYYVEGSETGELKTIKRVATSNNGVITNQWQIIEGQNNYPDVIFPPDNGLFTKYKLSMSFDSIRCDEPRTLNSDEFCVVSFGGSATLASDGVAMGNDLVRLSIRKYMIKAKTDISISDEDYHWLEPLELPSGNNADTRLNQLISNNFVNNSHTDSLSISTQYTFVLDRKIALLNQFFKYARYGKQADGSTITYTNGITPNMIYTIDEMWSSWGEVEVMSFKAKIVESIDIENTESDTLTITIPFQVQGENN